MDIRKCFETLEIDRGSSLEEARQAYKDLVTIWHPDRFSRNPRLREKAENKLKEINAAYEAVSEFLTRPPGPDQGPSREEGEAAPSPEGPGQEGEERDRAEIIAEAGTRLLLNAWASLSGALRRLVDEAVGEEGPGARRGPGRPGQGRPGSYPPGRGKGAGAGRHGHGRRGGGRSS